MVTVNLHCPVSSLFRFTVTGRTQKDMSDHCCDCHWVFQLTCTKNNKHEKTITRHVWEDAKEKANELRLSKWGKKVYARRKETVERSFADAKQHHGHRYARFRGLSKVQMQCLLAATAQNMKKMALLALLCAFLVAINHEIRRWRGCKRGRNLLVA